MNELMKACLTVILVVSAIAMASLSAIAAEAVEYIHTDGLVRQLPPRAQVET